MKRIGILVVHGVGEQTHFEHLEEIASNLYKALSEDPQRKAHVQVRRGDQVPRHSPMESWREAPALLRWWCQSSNDWVEARLREVYWADLDMPLSWTGWFQLVGWALSVAGVKLFDTSRVWAARRDYMCLPKDLTRAESTLVRLELFSISLLFFLMLMSVGLLYGLLTRFSFRAQWLKTIWGTIYNYLGDVKLYQDWFVREDTGLETIGEKSRVAIRRRMVRALVRTAAEVEAGTLDGYYIFAHSLGTVVAFNGLMETNQALPNYLTEEEWNGLPTSLKREATHDAPQIQMPRRPPWLKLRDAINRARLFAGLRGFLTMGSPLDKFAALWPVIVPINRETIPGHVPWVNVADSQDIVAARLDLFRSCDQTPGIGGLHLSNVEWADQRSLFSAHTSYWKGGKRHDRLIDRLIPWLEGGQLAAPADSFNLVLARLVYTVSLTFLGGLLLGFAALLAWFVLGRLTHVSTWPVWDWMIVLLGTGIVVVAVCSVSRHLWERRKFGSQEK